MNQLTPNSQFAYVIQLGDPADSGRNYVQSVVRLSATSSVVSTMDMTNVSGQRFVGAFLVPPDVSGLGYYLDITSTVYSDAGYSSLNENYPIQTSSFLVLQPFTQSSVGGSPGGYSDDAELRKRLERIEASILGVKIPEYKEADLSPLADMIEGMRAPDPVDLSPILEAIGRIKMPEPAEQSEVDLYPVVEGIQNLARSHEDLGSMISKKVSESASSMRSEMRKSHDELIGKVSDLLEKNGDDRSRERMREMMTRMIDDPSISARRKEEPKRREMDPRINDLIKPIYA